MAKFKDPIAPTQRKQGTKPWDFTKPTYDQARAGTIQAGDNYGVGYSNPVGTFSNSSMNGVPEGFSRFSVESVLGEEKN